MTKFKVCVACGLAIAVSAESAFPPHECPERQPRCDFAIKQDNPHGPENDPRPIRTYMQEMYMTTSSASFTGSWSMRIAGYPKKT